ncbi:hypothetical protein Q8A67_024171 [Cirrhinus molitorella]|uniref:Uncharacterized protein n=1 Tax=Cirrhinus molitorella TaxID=172907 RepID=A0AA88TD88_9TELE|nr:hypothetical protein Q8A67_024171 [Cirrhinus molitorella]
MCLTLQTGSAKGVTEAHIQHDSRAQRSVKASPEVMPRLCQFQSDRPAPVKIKDRDEETSRQKPDLLLKSQHELENGVGSQQPSL